MLAAILPALGGLLGGVSSMAAPIMGGLSSIGGALGGLLPGMGSGGALGALGSLIPSLGGGASMGGGAGLSGAGAFLEGLAGGGASAPALSLPSPTTMMNLALPTSGPGAQPVMAPGSQSPTPSFGMRMADFAGKQLISGLIGQPHQPRPVPPASLPSLDGGVFAPTVPFRPMSIHDYYMR